MARRSVNRDIYEAKMNLHPEHKATMLIASPYRKHKKMALAYSKLGEAIQNNLADTTQENIAEVQQGQVVEA